MEHRSASIVLARGTEQEIRRLRFADPEVERAFRQEYAEKSRRHLRVVTGLGLLVGPTLALLNGLLQALPVPPPQMVRVEGNAILLVMLVNLGAFLVTLAPQFPRLFQPYMAFTVLFTSCTILATWLPQPGVQSPLPTGALVTYTLYRLRLAPAALVYWTQIAFFLVYGIWVVHSPAETLMSWLGIALGANALGMIAGYTLEYAARRDFLLLRLLEQEQGKSERLLLNMLPKPVAERLKENPGTVADSFPEVTVLFADIVDFTLLSARLSAERTVALLDEVFSCFDSLAEKHRLEKIKTIGDAYMVVGGLPEPRADHAEAVVALALDMQHEIARFRPDTGEPLELRIGIHTGPVVAGVIGTKRLIYDLWGDTVNMASRMESHGLASTIQVTEATYERVRHCYGFEERRLVNVKGRGDMTAYLLQYGARQCESERDAPAPGPTTDASPH